MKKCFLLLVVLVLLAGLCPVACMETHAGEAAFSVELGSSLMALIEGEMEHVEAARALEKVLENATWQVQTDGEDMAVRLLLGGKELAYCCLHEQDGQLLLTTSLLPGMAILLPVEEQEVDPAVIKDMVCRDVKNYLGDGKAGTFMLEGLSEEPYDTHYVIDVQDDALKQMVSSWVLTVSPENWTDVFSVKGGYEPEAENTYTLCDLYTREDGGFAFLLRDVEDQVCTDLLLAGDGGEYVFALLPKQEITDSVVQNTVFVMENGCTEGVLVMAEKLEDSFNLVSGFYAAEMEWNLTYSQEKLNGAWYSTLVTEIADAEMYMGAVGDFVLEGDKVTGTFSVRYPENETLFTLCVNGTGTVSALPECSYERIVDVENMTDEQAEELTALVTGSAIKAFIYAASVMPDEIAVLTNYFVMLENDMLGIIGGADGPTTIVLADKTETPTEEPAAEPTAKPTARPLFGQ